MRGFCMMTSAMMFFTFVYQVTMRHRFKHTSRTPILGDIFWYVCLLLYLILFAFENSQHCGFLGALMVVGAKFQLKKQNSCFPCLPAHDYFDEDDISAGQEMIARPNIVKGNIFKSFYFQNLPKNSITLFR